MLFHTPKILISACLLGEAIRYDGGDCCHHLSPISKVKIQIWKQQGLLLSLCPEVAGGLAVPRPAAEIQGVYVKTEQGLDVSAEFQAGAQAALALCLKHGIKLAILKQGSPSCGNGLINDGTFTKHKIEGQGITAQLLQAHGVQVLNEYEIETLEILREVPKGEFNDF